MLYASKFFAMLKLIKIHELMKLIKINSDPIHKVLIVYLAYNFTDTTSRFKLSLKDRLTTLGLDINLLNKLPILNFPENHIYPPFLFILGFFLGDGT